MNVFPVTTSQLSSKALGDFVKTQYQLQEDFNCKLLKAGINHTYLLENNTDKFVLRVYVHKWRSKVEIEAELRILNLLKENELPVSYPIADKSGNYIQEINAPEGIRFAVLFSFATGEKVRELDPKTCSAIGELMGGFHKLTAKNSINRTNYSNETLLNLPYNYLREYFSEELPEMQFINNLKGIVNADFEKISTGVVHLDIWYDNMAVINQNEITLFDFDFCGNGPQILDLGYFCHQLFQIESDKDDYESKVKKFIEGYQSVNRLSDLELSLIPRAGVAVFIFYLGVQARRYDWSNLFLTKNYLKMFLGRIKDWMTYHKVEL